ncbi:MAG: putative ABC transporter permease [Enterocloster sp.]
MNIYDYINWFFMYSFLGYLLECVVLSVEYKRPVVNRGFGHGPFCIIYGFGAAGACLLLQPMSGRPVELYTASMTMATTMELVTANVMVRLFGSFWWDYSHKPFNYKGIICLESSLAWGFLGLFFFYFLDSRVRSMVDRIPHSMGNVLAVGLTVFYLADFLYCFRHRLGGMAEEEGSIGRLKVF